MTELEQFINLGLATAISIYLVMWVTKEISKKLDEMNKAIRDLVDNIKEVGMYVKQNRC